MQLITPAVAQHKYSKENELYAESKKRVMVSLNGGIINNLQNSHERGVGSLTEISSRFFRTSKNLISFDGVFRIESYYHNEIYFSICLNTKTFLYGRNKDISFFIYSTTGIIFPQKSFRKEYFLYPFGLGNRSFIYDGIAIDFGIGYYPPLIKDKKWLPPNFYNNSTFDYQNIEIKLGITC
ncbi:MAG: hypothetical protein HYY40_00470, partial [Bacteroidetes bacterium]|nr:hypothetical protein [Bacteroidota bacterium]